MKKLLSLLFACVLVCALTGCDKLDYGKAVDLFNRGKYDAAIDAFYELGDYEDSKELFTLSHYWAAIQRMEDGNFAEALPRFLKLGDYEDSAQRAAECTYQMALAEFEAGNLGDAQTYFEDVADYKQAKEYLRRINWQAMYDAIAAQPIEVEQNGKRISILAEPNLYTLMLSVEIYREDPFAYTDELYITLTRDSTQAEFHAASSFDMAFVDSRIGATQSASGRIDITTCTANTVLALETFEKTVTDNQGNTTTATDPAASLMGDTLAQNMRELMEVIPQMLLDAGIEVTLQDIGFYAM